MDTLSTINVDVAFLNNIAKLRERLDISYGEAIKLYDTDYRHARDAFDNILNATAERIMAQLANFQLPYEAKQLAKKVFNEQ
jgi:hypothetical protein